MNKKHWLVAFIILLVANLAGIQINNELLQSISKPLIIPSLAGYFLFSLHNISNSFKKSLSVSTSLKLQRSKAGQAGIITALLFSWAGDILLMFQGKNSLFFLLGLSSFLLAHIFYIIFFHNVRVKENVKGNPWLLVMVVIYYAALIKLLLPWLADMKYPVLVYGVVISFMLMLAMHMLFIKNKPAGRWMMIGALFFVVSDSILAINKFYQAFELAGILIMITYGLAQLFIVAGATRYINSANKE